MVAFSREVLGEELDPWQQWTVVHGGELLPDGRPRFRVLVVLVARQSGKTHLLRTLTLYWLFVERQRLILSTSTNRDTAKESWRAAVATAQSNPYLRAELGPNAVRTANGEESLTTAAGCRYRIAASNRRGGRGMTINRLVMDELREHATWDAWNASSYATSALPDAQTWAISNQGDDSSIVLDALRDAALGYLQTGEGDSRLGLIEYSSPDGSDPIDVEALAQANPALGIRGDLDSLLGVALRAKAAGGEELASFRVEAMCMRVRLLDPALDPDRWEAAGTDEPADLAQHRRRVALCFDVSMDAQHATAVVAAVIDGKVHLEAVGAWSGPGCTRELRRELPGLVREIRPRRVGWFPGGPAAAVGADVGDHGHRSWPPRGVEITEITGEVTGACMALSELVDTGDLQHARDELLDQQAAAAQRLWQGDRWRFTRRGATPVDAMYASAGAAQLARSLPPPLAPVEVV